MLNHMVQYAVRASALQTEGVAISDAYARKEKPPGSLPPGAFDQIYWTSGLRKQDLASLPFGVIHHAALVVEDHRPVGLRIGGLPGELGQAWIAGRSERGPR